MASAMNAQRGISKVEAMNGLAAKNTIIKKKNNT
jgi:hypothetical protein